MPEQVKRLQEVQDEAAKVILGPRDKCNGKVNSKEAGPLIPIQLQIGREAALLRQLGMACDDPNDILHNEVTREEASWTSLAKQVSMEAQVARYKAEPTWKTRTVTADTNTMKYLNAGPLELEEELVDEEFLLNSHLRPHSRVG